MRINIKQYTRASLLRTVQNFIAYAYVGKYLRIRSKDVQKEYCIQMWRLAPLKIYRVYYSGNSINSIIKTT